MRTAKTRRPVAITVVLLSLTFGLGGSAWAQAEPAPAPPGDPEPTVAPAAAADGGGEAAEAGAEAAAEADASEPGGTIAERGGLAGVGLVVGLKVGGSFGQVTSDLGAAFVPELELGYTLPFADRALEVFLSGQWAAPTMTGGAEADARLPGDGAMTFELTQQEAILSLGLLYRIPLSTPVLRPYVGVAGRVYLMRTDVTGQAGGEAFGANEETGTSWGVLGLAGVDFFLGPGALLAELQFGWAPLDGKVLADTNTGALGVMVGYRLFL